MRNVDGMLARFREQRKRSAELLHELESGTLSLGERRGSSQWVDTTQREIERLRHEVEQFDILIAACEGEASAP